MERIYQPIWPDIEARIGPAGGRAIDRFAASRLALLASTPDDAHAVRDGVRSFILLGRYEDAIEQAGSPKIVEGMGEDAVAIALYRAQALTALGKRDDALASLAPFTTLDLNKTPEAVNGVIGLAEMLDESGRAEAALKLADAALAAGSRGALSTYGVRWLERTRGRTVEAAKQGDALRAGSADNEAAAVEGLLCLGRKDEAAAIAIHALGSVEGTSTIADQFQPSGAFWAASESRLRALWAPLLARPDVKAAFDKSARILPQSLWPAKEPRPNPHTAPTGPGGGDDVSPTT
jgi:tetratricopeptide (TPR) repeat protein